MVQPAASSQVKHGRTVFISYAYSDTSSSDVFKKMIRALKTRHGEVSGLDMGRRELRSILAPAIVGQLPRVQFTGRDELNARLHPGISYDHLSNGWFDLNQQSALSRLQRVESVAFFNLMTQSEQELPTFIALDAKQAQQHVLAKLVMWARRVAPLRLWRYLLAAHTRRSNAASWSIAPPGQSAASSRRAPRGPSCTQMALTMSSLRESLVTGARL
jgi:hypothetical protein